MPFLMSAGRKRSSRGVFLRYAGRVSLLIAVALAFCLISASQIKLRDVSGLVTDKRGNPLPRAVVLLENTADLTVRSFVTGDDGRYRFEGLNQDIDFTLTARYREHWSKQKTVSKFSSAAHAEVNLVIPVE